MHKTHLIDFTPHAQKIADGSGYGYARPTKKNSIFLTKFHLILLNTYKILY